MLKPWIFQSNTFEVNTRGSHVAGLSLVTDTDAKLHAGIADPDILVAYNLLHPVYDAYRIININYDMVKGNYKGDTLAFSTLMDTLPLNLRIWESGVRAVYIEDSHEEVAIFPNKRNPFLNGTYEDRITAIGALELKLSSIVPLAATHALVQSFYNAALSTRLTQQEEEGTVAQQSDLREKQRILVMDGMYGVLGLLMHKYRADRDRIASYFDLTLLRSAGSSAQPIELSGLVLDKVTNLPLANAIVKAVVNDKTFTTTTAPDGNYKVVVDNLTEATDALMGFAATGYVDKEEAVVLVPGENQVVNAALTPEAP